MTTKHLTFTALALVLAALPLVVAAGGRVHKGGPGGPAGDFPFGHGPGLEGFLDRAACRLDLSDEQQAQVGAILEGSRSQMEALREQAAEARETFHGEFDPGTFDEAAATAFAQGQSELHTQMMVLGLRTLSQIWTVLTPEQREKLEEMRTTMKEHRRHRRGGGPLGS